MLKDRIKEERNKKNISQQKLAQSIGVSQQTVGSWEIGRTEPNQLSIKKLCTYFGISPNSLLGIDTNQDFNTSLSKKRKKDITKDLEELSYDDILNYIDKHLANLPEEKRDYLVKRVIDRYWESKNID